MKWIIFENFFSRNFESKMFTKILKIWQKLSENYFEILTLKKVLKSIRFGILTSKISKITWLNFHFEFSIDHFLRNWNVLFSSINGRTCPNFRTKVNGGASLRWSFGPHSAWGSIESTTILTTHPSLGLSVQWMISCMSQKILITVLYCNILHSLNHSFDI